MKLGYWSLIIFLLVSCKPTKYSSVKTDYWSDIDVNSEEGIRKLSLRIDVLKNAAAEAKEIAIPLPEGEFINVKIEESHTMSPELAKKYPEIKSYVVLKSSEIISGRIDINPSGFFAMITTDANTFFINPDKQGSEDYLCYNKSSAKKDMNNPFIDKVINP